MMCTQGELSAKSQEQRLRNYDPANNLASKVILSLHVILQADHEKGDQTEVGW